MTEHPATGEQYRITRGSTEAVLTELAAGLRVFTVGGEAMIESYPLQDTAPMGAGLVLVPWPNRIAQARWSKDGSAQQLDVTEPALGNAIHGLLRNTAYRLIARSESGVTLGARIHPQHGYPYLVNTQVQYELTDEGELRVTHRLDNEGTERAPFAIGAHPYLRIGDVPSAELTVTIDAATRLRTDELQIPNGREPVSGDFDLRRGRRVGELDLDDCLTDIAAAGAHLRHTVSAPDGRTLTLWAERKFCYVQVFTPIEFPGRSKVIAIEPMTAAPNAFNSGAGLRWLEPGESFAARWGLSFHH